MIHKCNLNCYSMNPTKLENLGMEDNGKWLPFIFDINSVEAAKLTTDDESLPIYNCTTIFTKSGETYIIDTPPSVFFPLYEECSKKWENFGGIDNDDDDDDRIFPQTENDLNL